MFRIYYNLTPPDSTSPTAYTPSLAAMLQMAYIDIGLDHRFTTLIEQGLQVRTVWRNTDCSAFLGLHELVSLWDEENVNVFIG